MQVKTPDIGVEKATVAEILVKVGDQISENDSLILLESDKASVEVPSGQNGTVTRILVSEGDEVSEGTALVELESAGESDDAAPQSPAAKETQPSTKEAQSDQQRQSESAPDQQAPAQSTQAPAEQGSSKVIEVNVPDIGVEKATVAELLVSVGDQIAENDSLILLESDKASVEVPSPAAGQVESIDIAVGDSVKEGVVLLTLKVASAKAEQNQSTDQAAPTKAEPKAQAKEPASTQAASSSGASAELEVKVPDLGVDQATVAEVLVKVGDQVTKDESILVVESDKATVEVPSPETGTVKAVHLKAGDQVSEGVLVLSLTTAQESNAQALSQPSGESSASANASDKQQSSDRESAPKQQTTSAQANDSNSTSKLSQAQEQDNAKVYAGPAVRKLARELGVILSQVKASGEHDRLVKEDIYAFVKQQLTSDKAKTNSNEKPTAVASSLPKLPDFSAFGGSEVKAMTRLQQVSVPQLSLNNFIPQVTQFDLADITELEAWRGELKAGFKKDGVSLTILAFIAKAVAHLLKEEPYFAGHLADDQKSVLLRHEIHMGIAVATPDGLTVPVLRNPDRKSIREIAVELGELSQKARDKKLSPKDLQGANFTITSLGSIGGTAFTPLVNWPQVAILGISPATMQPIWNGQSFDPKLMLPLSLSYDHRVINGADAARFTNKLTKLLGDIRSLLL